MGFVSRFSSSGENSCSNLGLCIDTKHTTLAARGPVTHGMYSMVFRSGRARVQTPAGRGLVRAADRGDDQIPNAE